MREGPPRWKCIIQTALIYTKTYVCKKIFVKPTWASFMSPYFYHLFFTFFNNSCLIVEILARELVVEIFARILGEFAEIYLAKHRNLFIHENLSSKNFSNNRFAKIYLAKKFLIFSLFIYLFLHLFIQFFHIYLFIFLFFK